jgi:DNA polymerase-1
MGKLFIVDLMPFLYRGHFVFLRNPRMTASGINTSALLGLVNGLLGIIRRENPTHLVLAMDPGGPTFRHESYAPYKAQRDKMPEDIALSIGYAYELAEALKIPVVKVDGFEADDVMGTLAVNGAEAGFDVYMATPDKDAAQLVRKGISLYRPAHAGDAAEIYDEKKVCEKWSLTSPVQMIEYLALAGDTADNIPGIRGVGEKTAVQLLSQFGDIEGIIANASSIKGKLGEKVAAGAEDARISKFLTTIRTDVPLSFDWESCKRDGVDAEKLAAVCAKYELNKLAGEMLSDASVAVESTNDPDESSLSDITSAPHDYRLVKTEDEAESLLAELMQCKKVAFDTETDSVDAHTCKLVGFSFAVEGGKAWYVEGSLIDIFRPLFSDASKTLVGHNVKFDRTVLQRYGIGMASHPHDTMLAHYCLDAAARHGMDALARRYLSYRTIPIEKLIGEKERGKTQLSMAALKPEEILDYAAEDADVTLKLDEVLRPFVAETGASTALEKSEEPLIKILIGMERAGVKIDVAALREYGRELDKEILSYAQTIHSYADPGFNPDSPKQLGELLFGKLKLDPLSARRTQTGQYSTDEKTLSKLVGLHPVVQAVLDYRACSKLKSTYVDKLPTLIDADGRVHTTYSQAFTETGRLSSADPNLQNIPIRTERGKMIRKAFVSRDDGHVLVSADYSQIELRIMAALSKDEAMLQAFRDGVDIHRETASRVYGVMSAFVTDEQRSKCKMVNFGIIYGISAFGLSQRLKVSRKEATSLIEAYFKLYPGVKRYMDEAVRSAREKGYAETILGRRRTLKDINSRNATIRQAAERDAMNTPIQGSAADLIKLAMVRVDAAIKEAGLKAQMVLQIHDELVFDVPLAEVDTLKEIVRREMSGAYDFGVPLEVGIGSGKNWLEAH